MNLFDDTLLKDTFKSITTHITFNFDSDDQYTIDCFISNATFSPNSSYHIHSLDTFKRGDYFQLENNIYMVTGDVITTRGAKYKSVADYCNIKIDKIEIIKELIGHDDRGRPIYNEIPTVTGEIYGVIRHRQHVEEGSGLIIGVSELLLTIQDNPYNRNTYKLNYEVTFEGVKYKVREVILTKQGLIQLRLNSN